MVSALLLAVVCPEFLIKHQSSFVEAKTAQCPRTFSILFVSMPSAVKLKAVYFQSCLPRRLSIFIDCHCDLFSWCAEVVRGKCCFNEVWLLIWLWCLFVELGIWVSLKSRVIRIIRHDVPSLWVFMSSNHCVWYAFFTHTHTHRKWKGICAHIIASPTHPCKSHHPVSLQMTMRMFVENNYTKKEITLLPKYIPLYVMEI